MGTLKSPETIPGCAAAGGIYRGWIFQPIATTARPPPDSPVVFGCQMGRYQQHVSGRGTHLKAAGVQNSISCEKNVWLSSRVMQTALMGW